MSTPGTPFSGLSFPECCDLDNDGFGTLVPPPNPAPNSGSGAMSLAHGATADQIKTGQQVIKRINDASGVELGAFTTTLQYVFATVPALASYHDTANPTPTAATLSYPYPEVAVEFPVASGPDGDVVVTLTFWRPQRRRIAADPEPQAGESAVWMDIGSLNYSASFADGSRCPQNAFSEDDPTTPDVEDDPNLTFPSGARNAPASRTWLATGPQAWRTR